jgi:hypothetical protein
VHAELTLVVVRALLARARLGGVAVLALALEGAQRVVAGARAAHVRPPLLALVDVWNSVVLLSSTVRKISVN